MIEADQTTEAPPSAADKEDAAPIPAHPANPAPPEGQDCTVVFLKSLLFFVWKELVNNEIPNR